MPYVRPKPLISVPRVSTLSDDNSSEESDSDTEDVMTAEEEAAARRYLSGGGQTEQRRLSSLDVYLAQPQATTESLIINRRRSMRDEEEDIAKMNAADEEVEEEEARRLKLQREREAVRREREAKREKKQADGPDHSSSPITRKRTNKCGFGGLDKEKRKKLKEIIMKKAKEELQSERLKEMHAREDYLRSILPSFSLDGLTEQQLQNLIQTWHNQAQKSLEQTIELGDRVRRQDEEIQLLTMRLIDIKGKYPMPILRKVPKKDNIFARLEKLRTINSMHVIKPDLLAKSKGKSASSLFSSSGVLNGNNEEGNHG